MKTFSTGPCSFSLNELWFTSPPLPGAGVQHLLDSRHGRIACKTSLPAVPLRCKVAERSRLQSVLRARGQHLHWLAATLQNSRSHCVFAGCPNIRLGSYSVASAIRYQAALASLHASAFVAIMLLVLAAFRSNHLRHCSL